MNLEKFNYKEPFDVYDGCINCPHSNMCSNIEIEDGGYAQAGYTPYDEYGECPSEFRININKN